MKNYNADGENFNDCERLVEMEVNDFFEVIDFTVLEHQSEDVTIWYNPDNPEGGIIGCDPDPDHSIDGFHLKADPDWAIALYEAEKNGDNKSIMRANKIHEVGTSFISWCENRGLKIIIYELK